MQAVVLAGGLGTRIRAVSGNLPKGLIPIQGVPFLLYQMNWLYRNGIENILILTGYGSEEIKSVLGHRFRNLSISYSDEGEKLMGTAGALRLALDRNLLEPGFILLYGDSFLPVDLSVFLSKSKGSDCSIMGVLKNDNSWDRSNVIFSNGYVNLYDKEQTDPIKAGMRYIDYGVSFIKRDIIFDDVRPGEVQDLAPIFNKLSVQGKLYGFEFNKRFFEIGSPEGLSDFKSYVSANPEAVPVLGVERD